MFMVRINGNFYQQSMQESFSQFLSINLLSSCSKKITITAGNKTSYNITTAFTHDSPQSVDADVTGKVVHVIPLNTETQNS